MLKVLFALCLIAITTGASQAQFLLIDLVNPPKNSNAAPNTKYIVNYGDWVKECRSLNADEVECEISTIAMSETFSGVTNDVNLVGLIKRHEKDPIFYFRLPLGFLIAKTPRLKADGNDIGDVTIRTCQKTGCIIPFKLDANLLTKFRRGARLSLEIYDLGNTKHTLSYSLIGFTKAYFDKYD